jgi:hypothetical protein
MVIPLEFFTRRFLVTNVNNGDSSVSVGTSFSTGWHSTTEFSTHLSPRLAAISHQIPSLLFTGFQLNSLASQLLHVTSQNFTAARLVSSLYNLETDPTENTASSNPSIVFMGDCLAIDWISLPRDRVYRPLLNNGYFFSWSLHSNSNTRYNKFRLCCKRKQKPLH